VSSSGVVPATPIRTQRATLIEMAGTIRAMTPKHDDLVDSCPLASTPHQPTVARRHTSSETKEFTITPGQAHPLNTASERAASINSPITSAITRNPAHQGRDRSGQVRCYAILANLESGASTRWCCSSARVTQFGQVVPVPLIPTSIPARRRDRLSVCGSGQPGPHRLTLICPRREARRGAGRAHRHADVTFKQSSMS